MTSHSKNRATGRETGLSYTGPERRTRRCSSELAWRAPRGRRFSNFWEVVSARDFPPDSGHLFRLDRACDAPGYALRLRRVVTYLLAQACQPRCRILKFIPRTAGHGPIRLLDGWGFRDSYRLSDRHAAFADHPSYQPPTDAQRAVSWRSSSGAACDWFLKQISLAVGGIQLAAVQDYACTNGQPPPGSACGR